MAVAFSGEHGPFLIVGEVGGLFYLLQSLYMVWVGLLLGELRRASGSWVTSWAGHAGYNVAVLCIFSSAMIQEHPALPPSSDRPLLVSSV